MTRIREDIASMREQVFTADPEKKCSNPDCKIRRFDDAYKIHGQHVALVPSLQACSKCRRAQYCRFAFDFVLLYCFV